EVLPDAPLRDRAHLVALLGAAQGPFAVQGRRRLSELLLPGQSALPPRRDRLGPVHEPLRDPLALLPLHERRGRRPPEVLQQRLTSVGRENPLCRPRRTDEGGRGVLRFTRS